MTDMNNKLSGSEPKVISENIKNYIWKGPKKILPDGTIEQTQKKLIDCTTEELQNYLSHCNDMLHNNDIRNPGRYHVKKEVYEQIIKCNAELFLREQVSNGVSRFILLNEIRNLLVASNVSINELDGYTLQDIIVDLKKEYHNIPISIVIDSCLDKAGLFTKKHLTITFILKQGLWLSPEEFVEHEDEIKGKSKIEKEEYFKKVLNVNKKHTLKINSSGLSLAQLKEALNIKDAKYSQMSTEKLNLLRNYLLFVLLKDIDNHIDQWLQISKKIQAMIVYKSN